MKKLISEIVELSSDERSQIDQIIPKIVQAYQEGAAAEGEAAPVGSITYKMRSAENLPRLQKQQKELQAKLEKASDDQKPPIQDKLSRIEKAISTESQGGKVSILLSNKHRQHPDNIEAMYLPVNLANLQDNVISINHNLVSKYFGLKGKLTGREKEGEQQLRRILTHELVHAKDPTLNHLKPGAEGRQVRRAKAETEETGEFDIEAYFKKPEEALAFTSQLNDVVVRLVSNWIDNNLKTGEEIVTRISGVGVPMIEQTDRVLYAKAEEIQDALRDLDQLFAKGLRVRSFSPLGRLFLKEIESEGIFRKFFKKIYNFLEKIGLSKKIETPQDSYVAAMELLKKHNPEGYRAAAVGFRKSFKKLELTINSALFKRTVALLKAVDNLPNLINEKTKLEKELRNLKVIPSTSREKRAELENQIGKLETLIKTATRIKANPNSAKVVQISVEGTDPPKEEVADSTKVNQTKSELNATRGKLYPKQAVTELTAYKSRIVEQVYNKIVQLIRS